MTTSSESGPPMLACLLISGSEASHAVAGQLRRWSEAGFLVPFLIAELAEVSGMPGPAPLIRGRLVAGGRAPQPCDVLRLVAEGDWEHIVLMSLFDVEAGTGRGADPGTLTRAVAQEMLDAMPVQADLLRGGPRRLTAVRLFAPTTDPDIFPQSWAAFDPVWSYSLVLSPEDRSRPDAVADHIRWPGNYASHVAGAVAGLAGLWSGLGQPGLPTVPGVRDESGTPDPAVQVVRVANRIASAAAPLEPITRKALAVAGGTVPPPPGSGSGLRPAGGATSRALCQKAYLALRNHPSQTLHYQPEPPATPDADVEMAGAELFDNYWRFLLGQPRGQKRHTFKGALIEPIVAPLTATRRWIDRTVQNVFQGDETGRVFRTAPDLPHEMALDWSRRWEQASEYGRQDDPFDPEADAVFWSQLRDWTLGLVDGQRPEVNPDRSEVVDVVSDRTLIVAGPVPAAISEATLHLVTSDASISAFDASTTNTLLHELEVALDAPHEEPSGEAPAEPEPPPPPAPAPTPRRAGRSPLWLGLGIALLVVACLAFAAENLSAAVVLAVSGVIGLLLGLTSPSGPAVEEAAPGLPYVPHPDGALIDASVLRDADPQLIEELSSDRALIPGWLREYGATVLGRLSTDLASDIHQATIDDARYRGQFSQLETPDFTELSKRRTNWLATFWFCLLGYPAVLYAGVYLYNRTQEFAITFPWGWEISKQHIYFALFCLLTGMVVFGLVRAVVRYYKAFARARHRLRRHALLCAALVRQRDHAQREATRLRHVNERLTKWSEVYAWLLLRPFESQEGKGGSPEPEAEPAESQPPPDEQAADPEPLSRALGTQISEVELTVEFEDSELRNAVAASASRGYMHDLFLSLARHALGHFGLEEEELVRELDRDGRGETSYLTLLVREVRSPISRQAVRAELAEKVSVHRARYAQSTDGEFGAMQLSELSGTVSQFLTALSVDGSSMRNSLFRPLAQLEMQHRLTFGRLWTHSEQASSAAGELITTFLPVDPDPDRLQLDAVRVDSTDPIHPANLVCFVGSPGPSGWRRPTWDDATSGLV